MGKLPLPASSKPRARYLSPWKLTIPRTTKCRKAHLAAPRAAAAKGCLIEFLSRNLKCPPGSTSVSSILAAGLSASSLGGRGPFQPRDTTAGRSSNTATVGNAPSKSTSILNVKITFQQSEDPKETIQSAICSLLKMFQKYDRSPKSDTYRSQMQRFPPKQTCLP